MCVVSGVDSGGNAPFQFCLFNQTYCEGLDLLSAFVLSRMYHLNYIYIPIRSAANGQVCYLLAAN